MQSLQREENSPPTRTSEILIVSSLPSKMSSEIFEGLLNPLNDMGAGDYKYATTQKIQVSKEGDALLPSSSSK